MQDSIIVGGDSHLGRALKVEYAGRGRHVLSTTRRSPTQPDEIPVDLGRPDTFLNIPKGIKVAFLLAGQTSISVCEEEPKTTGAINVEGMLQLIEYLASREVHIVYTSTNLVLSGRTASAEAHDRYAPQCTYAKQKAIVEQAALALSAPATIVRLTKVTSGLTSLVAGWRKNLHSGQAITPFLDVVCAPISEAFVVDALISFGDSRPGGVMQLSGDIDISYADIAFCLAKHIKADANLVRPIKSTDTPINIQCRPAHTSLNCASTEKILGRSCPSTSASLRALFDKVDSHVDG